MSAGTKMGLTLPHLDLVLQLGDKCGASNNDEGKEFD